MTTATNNAGRTDHPAPRARRRRRGSLFFKLLAAMAVTVLITLFALAVFFGPWWNKKARDFTMRNLHHYAELLTHEIGTPPDYARAAALSDSLQLGVAIRAPDRSWWFSPRVPEHIRERILTREREREAGILSPPPGDMPGRLRPPGGEPDSGPRLHMRRGRMLAIIPANGYTFIYGAPRRQPFEKSATEWLLLFVVMGMVWFGTWWFLRRQLQPVRDLSRGVKAVEDGNLDARIPEKGSDELADLAASFNAMTRSLKERLQARDQLLLDVSHELRSPLTRMRVALEMAEPGSAVDSLREEVEALGKMVSEILETERLNSQAGVLKREPGFLGTLLAEKVARFEGQPPGIILDVAPLPPVPMDEERIRLVLRNIIENALKHGREAAEPVRVSARRDGHFALIEVRDSGPGVPEDEQRLIFEPFYRTDRSRSGIPGYGLGLPLCKRVVEAHGGTISFSSRPGDGTTVSIRLPLE